jgi:protein-tyrosine phosphatase
MSPQILVVCIGNICRSPMAMGLFSKQMPDCEIKSAGLGALVGHPADEQAQKLLQRRGIDISSHRGAMLTIEACNTADIIFVMNSEQKEVLERNCPVAKGKVFRLGHFNDCDIFDPYKQGEEEFSRCFEIIENSVTKWVDKINLMFN